MKPTVTRFDPVKSGTYQSGKLRAYDLVPEGMTSNLVFHFVEISPGAVLAPELNDVDKTLLIFTGIGVVSFDGAGVTVSAGDAIWLPKGSTHTIENSDETLRFIVVKAKA